MSGNIIAGDIIFYVFIYIFRNTIRLLSVFYTRQPQNLLLCSSFKVKKWKVKDGVRLFAAVGETGDQSANQQGDDQRAAAMADQGQGDPCHR